MTDLLLVGGPLPHAGCGLVFAYLFMMSFVGCCMIMSQVLFDAGSLAGIPGSSVLTSWRSRLAARNGAGSMPSTGCAGVCQLVLHALRLATLGSSGSGTRAAYGSDIHRATGHTGDSRLGRHGKRLL